MPDFKTEPERQAHMIKHADYFTLVCKIGVGRPKRFEFPTLPEAEMFGIALANYTNKLWGIYAVYGVYDHFVKLVKPNANQDRPANKG